MWQFGSDSAPGSANQLLLSSNANVLKGKAETLKRLEPVAVLREANLMPTDKPASRASAEEARAIFTYLFIYLFIYIYN